jgi:hypothetical protein
LEASIMKYDTSDLHGRQYSSDVGHAVLGSDAKSSSKRRWRAFLIPLVVLALGILLGMWGPLPGLGMLLTVGGVGGLVATAFLMLTDGFS